MLQLISLSSENISQIATPALSRQQTSKCFFWRKWQTNCEHRNSY